LPAPTWANHGAILKDSGCESASYRYYRVTKNILLL